MSDLKFHYRSAGKVIDGRPDRTQTDHDRKLIMMNGTRITPNLKPDEKKALQAWALTKGFSVVSVYSETKNGRTATWARTEPVALPHRKLAA
jgi:hypothetical protein